jgi:hypothetical protein
MTNSSHSTRKYVANQATTALAGMLAFWSLACGEGSIVPSSYHAVASGYSTRYSWEAPPRNPYYAIWEEIDGDHRKLQIIADFAERLINDSEELDPSYAGIVSSRLWELV